MNVIPMSSDLQNRTALVVTHTRKVFKKFRSTGLINERKTVFGAENDMKINFG